MAMPVLVSGTLTTLMIMLMTVMLLFRFRATYPSTRQTTPASLSFSDTMASVSGLARPSVKSDGFRALSYNGKPFTRNFDTLCPVYPEPFAEQAFPDLDLDAGEVGGTLDWLGAEYLCVRVLDCQNLPELFLH